MSSKRSAILEAATWLFSAKGYRETSTTDVTRLTGSADGTLFYHFESKERLFLAVLEEVKYMVEKSFVDFLASTTDMAGLEMLDAIAKFYLHLAADNEAQFKLLHRHDAYDLAKGNEECREILESIYDRFVAAFEDVIRRGQEDGSMGDLPVHKTALLVYTMIDGLVRLKHYGVYDAGSMYEDFMTGCQRLVEARGVTR